MPFLHRLLLRWYDAHRRDLPWRRQRDPYAIWLSEIMLQQTRVDTVIPYYERFLARFPTTLALAQAPLSDVLQEWSGLGYYRRAKLLHEGAQELARGHQGQLPSTLGELLQIRGIGRYTGGAIASIAFGERVPLVDGNVERVFSRLFALSGTEAAVKKECWKIAERLVHPKRPGDFNQALMELGALVCTRTPSCSSCPVRSECRAWNTDRVAEFPAQRQRKKPTPWLRTAFVCVVTAKRKEGPRRTRPAAPHTILVARRSTSGLWGGLWEPPMVDGLVDATHLGFADPGVACGKVRHVLSHRSMTVHVVRVDVERVPRTAKWNLEEYQEYQAVAPDLLQAGRREVAELPQSVLAAKVLRRAGALSERIA